MATVGGLSTSTSGSIRGYGGLASGLDRDTLIEGMTMGTTNKITQQQQKQQKLEWKQAAVQNITSKLLDFANKYTSSWSSSTNLFSSVFWGRNKITTSGEYSKFISVSGSGTSAQNVKIMGVKQLAQKATWSAAKGVSDSALKTGKVDFEDWQNLRNQDLTFEVDGKKYTVTLAEKRADGTAYNYSDMSNAAASIKEQLDNVKIEGADGSETTLGNKVSVSVSASGKQMVFEGTGATDESIKLVGGSAIGVLGFKSPTTEDGKYDLSNSGIVAAQKDDMHLITKFNDRVAGQELRFSYNGSAVSVYMPSASDFVDADGNPIAEDNHTAKLNVIKNSLQKQLDSAFGKNRIQVSLSDGGLKFETIKPVKAGEGDSELGDKKDKAFDTSSTLSITGGNMDLVNNVLNTKVGESNRINLSANIIDAGFAGITEAMFTETEKVTYKDAEGKEHTVDRQRATIDINGTKVAVYKDDTMNALMERINANTDVKVTYQAETDKFVFTSKEDGASGKIDIKGSASDAAASNITSDKTEAERTTQASDLVNKLFGTDKDGNREAVYGKDAVIAVQYAGSDEVVEINRGTNSFTMDGLTVNVKGVFGYDYDKDTDKWIRDTTTEAIEIDAQVDADSIVNAVKAMVEEYNSIIELVHKEVSTKPDRDYSPLTSEQKKELDEDEIEAWEKKAKEGILYADSDIRGLSSDLRFIIDGGIAQELSEMGLSTSSTYSDNGKLVFDETKFRAALAKDPERVQEIFANESVTNTNKNGTSTGIATRLKNVLDKYVNTTGSMDTKGILIRKAGHESSPMSVTENTMYKQLDSIKKKIAELQERLETERDRYIKQFTSLETLISQMNSQSSWLSQFGGY